MRLRAIRKTDRGGSFTLAEVLAALLLMAVVIPFAVEAMHIASRAGQVAAAKGEAALLAQRMLNENVVTTNWNQSVQGGTMMQGQHQFRYSLRNEPWTQDPNQNVIMLLSAEVFFNVQNREYSVRMSTLVDSSQPTNGTATASH
jgi:type II secretory pathway pseudopilin PulG